MKTSDFITIFVVLFFLSTYVFIILTDNENKNKKTKYDSINCVIDTIYPKKQESVSDYEPIYVYHTTCGEKLYLQNSNYNIGDTVVLTYKKK